MMLCPNDPRVKCYS